MIRSTSDLIFLLGSLSLLFITTLTAQYLGIKQVTSFSTFIFFLSSVYYLYNNPKILSQKHNETIIFYSAIVLVISIKITLLNDLESAIAYLKGWLTPVIFLLYLENINSNKRSLFKKVLIIFFLIECILSFYERYTSSLLFESKSLLELGIDEKLQDINIEFRSHSLLGEPLNNAHLLCIMIGIILTSSIKLLYTYLLLIIGIFSILCFNARAASLIIFIVSIIHIIKTKNKISRNQFIYLRIIIFTGIILTTYLLFNSPLGGRLINGDKLIDASAKSRFEAFDIFYKFSNINDPLIGNYSVHPTD